LWRRRESNPVDLRLDATRNDGDRHQFGDCAESPGDDTQHPKPEPTATLDAVEIALADALTTATKAERWDVVAQLARELEARRLARWTNVVVLPSAIEKSGRR
jgi:hypothetical protein